MHYRAIWISDLHLGTRGCNAEKILSFLKDNESDHLFLVGDIIDGWALKRQWFWPQEHNDIVQKILRKARKGTKVIFIPGNHDEFARQFIGLSLGDVEIHDQYLYQTLKGKKLLVLHGDEFDLITLNHAWLAKLGDIGYSWMLQMHRMNSWVRGKIGRPHWSLAGFLKKKIKNAVQVISQYEQTVSESCMGKADGVICGHIHQAKIKQMGVFTYYNCGDGVESCTSLVETKDGKMQLLDYHFNPARLLQRDVNEG